MPVDQELVEDAVLLELMKRVKHIEDGHTSLAVGARITKLEDYNHDHMRAYQRLDERISDMHANVVGEIGAFESRVHELENQPYVDLIARVKELEEQNKGLRARVTSLERERKELENKSDKWHHALADRIADLERERREQ